VVDLEANQQLQLVKTGFQSADFHIQRAMATSSKASFYGAAECFHHSGYADRVQQIIEDGVDINATNKIGYSALMSAARSYRLKIVSWLISRGTKVNAITSDGRSVLHCAIGDTPSQPARQGECVDLLLRAGADANVVTPNGHSPLMQAAWFGCPDAAKALLAHGADKQLIDSQGRTAENIGNERGHLEVVRMLASG